MSAPPSVAAIGNIALFIYMTKIIYQIIMNYIINIIGKLKTSIIYEINDSKLEIEILLQNNNLVEIVIKFIRNLWLLFACNIVAIYFYTKIMSSKFYHYDDPLLWDYSFKIAFSGFVSVTYTIIYLWKKSDSLVESLLIICLNSPLVIIILLSLNIV